MERPGLKAWALIALLAFSWAAPISGAAQLFVQTPRRNLPNQPPTTSNTTTRGVKLPLPVRFRNVRGRGLLVTGWINGSGPYTFAIDTGAGATLIRLGLVPLAGLSTTRARRTQIGGLSNATTVSGEQTVISDLALGEPSNRLPSRLQALIVAALPPGIDGIVDPTEAYSPLGYSIDLPGHELLAFDTRTSRLELGNEPPGGTVVRWVRESQGKRPLVRLGDERLALIDTGSGLGLGLTYDAIVSGNRRSRANPIRDLGGGTVESRRVAPTTVTIGSLVLRKVPTDILVGTHEDAPVILGRDALYPFKITFDPASRLIEIAPSSAN